MATLKNAARRCPKSACEDNCKKDKRTCSFHKIASCWAHLASHSAPLAESHSNHPQSPVLDARSWTTYTRAVLHCYQVTRLRALQRIDLAPGLLGLIPDKSADTSFCLCCFSSHYWSLQAALHHLSACKQ